MKEFRSEAPEEREVWFSLDGYEFRWVPPKQASLLIESLGLGQQQTSLGDTRLDQVRAQIDWIASGFSDRDREYLMGRLSDPDDSFDVDQLRDVMGWLVEQAAARPTKRSSASARRPSGTGESGAGAQSLPV